ncbi:MAG: hypothetical protein FD123_983 [Bacteroidetes bacterium]|nr:MAG: hypothetical protein FD123_983 [Bacteroidota bacterium]
MKRIFIPLLFLFACSSESTNGNDSLANKKTVSSPPLPLRDSITMNAAQSSVSWKRERKVKDVVQKIKFGKATIDMKLDEASFTLNGDIPVKNGVWYTTDKKFDGGVFRLDMTKLQGVKVNDEQQLEFSSPDYLDVANYPTSSIRIVSISKTEGEDQYEVKAELTIKDTTGQLAFPAKVRFDAGGVPQSLDGKFEINGLAWGLNRKNKKQKVVKDQLGFTVKLETGK